MGFFRFPWSRNECYADSDHDCIDMRIIPVSDCLQRKNVLFAVGLVKDDSGELTRSVEMKRANWLKKYEMFVSLGLAAVLLF